MAIIINDPSANWPWNYNANVGSLDTAEVEELTDVSLDPAVPYDQDVLQWDDGQSLWVNVDVLQGSLPVVYATWDSICKDSGITLSRDDRVAYDNTTYHLAIGTLGSDTVSKYYFELQNVNCSNRCNYSSARFGVGYVTNCTTLQGNDYHWYLQGDGYLKDSSDSILYSGMPSVGQGEYVGYAVEVVGTTCNVWVRSPDDGTWLHGDPETGTSPSFTFSTGGYEISPLCGPAWLTYVELKVRDADMKWGRPDGFYELRTNNFSTTTTSSTTTSTTTTSSTTVTFSTTSTTTTTTAPATSYTAKSVIFDIATNYGDSYLGLRSVDFYYQDSLITMTEGSNYVSYATSEYSTDLEAENAFDTSYSKTGGGAALAWHTSNTYTTDQRLIIVFDTAQTFDKIVVNNYHHAGTTTTRGANAVEIIISTDTITDTVYGNAISNSEVIFDGNFTEHIASDVADPETVVDMS